MDPVAAITDHAELIERLKSDKPFVPCRLALSQAMALEPSERRIVFRFGYRDVPFTGTVERRGSNAVVQLSGDIGPLPFSIQSPRRRRRALRTIAAARHETGLDWRLCNRHTIAVSGEVELPRPLTPAAIVAGAISVLLRGERHLELLLDVLGEAEWLSSRAA